MAVVDSYSPCPCGSGQKFKWCCHRAESYVDRALRLERNGQIEAALAALNEGLSKLPDTPWLALRKALLLAVLERTSEAREAVDSLLAKHPGHPGALNLKLRLLMGRGEIREAVDLFQDLATKAADRGETGPIELAAALGATLYRAGLVPAAIRHLSFPGVGPERAEAVRDELLTTLRSNRAITPWLKNPYKLLPCPGSAAGEAKQRFEDASRWAEAGLWARAAAAFDLLAADPQLGAAAEVNQGLCLLWLADHPAALAAIRRGIAPLGASTDAVDLEALCQLIDPNVGDDPIEEVELTWPIRDRATLLERLRADASCVERQDPEAAGDDEAPVEFALLDKPRLKEGEAFELDDLPLAAGDVVVEKDAVKLETFDDGRLNGLIDRFTAIAGHGIPPAHPRTKVLGKTSRQALAMDVACQPPDGMAPAEQRKLAGRLTARRIQERWVETPMVSLGGKTPKQAAAAGGFEVPLRAALTLLEGLGDWKDLIDWNALRAGLNVPPEPEIDPIDAELDEVHLGRLGRVDPHGLDDARLVDLHARAHAWGLPEVVVRAAREVASRRRLLEREGFPVVQVFTDLAVEAAADAGLEPALEWVRKGRESEPQARRAASAPSWDMLELRVRMLTEDPEAWVPFAATVMARYEGDAQAMQKVLSHMIELGLIQLAPSPDDPTKYVADPSFLYSLLMRYGPRVQAVGGAPAGGGIWTPGSGSPAGGGSGSGGGLWTPGSGSSPASTTEKKIILPGR